MKGHCLGTSLNIAGPLTCQAMVMNGHAMLGPGSLEHVTHGLGLPVLRLVNWAFCFWFETDRPSYKCLLSLATGRKLKVTTWGISWVRSVSASLDLKLAPRVMGGWLDPLCHDNRWLWSDACWGYNPCELRPHRHLKTPTLSLSPMPVTLYNRPFKSCYCGTT